eukprot:jgi/Botrbrau1/12638/Bobra.67_1s0004.1
MEKGLTGLDVEGEIEFRSSASVIAPPPAEFLPDLTRPRSSGMDAAVLLTADPLVLFERLHGARVDPATGAPYQIMSSPPPTNEPGLQQRLQDVGGTTEDFSARLRRYDEESSELARFYETFKNSFWNTVGAVEAPDNVKQATKAIVERVLHSRATAEKYEKAAAAAVAASSATQDAQESAAAAQQSLQGIARCLLLTKTAELQATSLLQQKGGDPAAADVLKAQSAEKCAQLLKAARAASAEALSAANASEQASDQAAQSLQGLGPVEMSAEAVSISENAQLKASGAGEPTPRIISFLGPVKLVCACARAHLTHWSCAFKVTPRLARRCTAAAAAKKAKDAFESAAALLMEVQAKLELPEQLLIEHKEQEPRPTSKQGANVSAAKAVAVPKEPEQQQCLEQHPLSRDVALELYTQWRMLEASYLEGLKTHIGSLSYNHVRMTSHFKSLARDFSSWLRRPTEEKDFLVSTFIAAFNGVNNDERDLPETRAELLRQCTESRDALWDLCDQRLRGSEAKLATSR